MRSFRRLPLLLRVASLLGLLFPLVGIAVLIASVISSLLSVPPHWSADGSRLLVIGVNLVGLGGACSFAVNTYSRRFRRPDGWTWTFPLDSWQSQARAIALLAALPLCALAVALLLPPGSLALGLAIGISLFAAVVLLVAYLLVPVGVTGSRTT